MSNVFKCVLILISIIASRLLVVQCDVDDHFIYFNGQCEIIFKMFNNKPFVNFESSA